MVKRRHATRKKAADLKGQKLIEVFLSNHELIEGTKRGYRDVDEGRFVTLEEAKKRLRDV